MALVLGSKGRINWWIVHLFKIKPKGNRQACDSHRGISLLSIAWQILASSLAEPPDHPHQTRPTSNHRGIRLATKLKVYWALVLPSLAYAYIWNLDCVLQTRQTAQSLPHDLSAKDTENHVAGQVSGFISSLSSLPSHFVHPTDASAGQIWAGHVVRMDSKHILKQLLFGKLTHVVWKALSRRAENG